MCSIFQCYMVARYLYKIRGIVDLLKMNMRRRFKTEQVKRTSNLIVEAKMMA